MMLTCEKTHEGASGEMCKTDTVFGKNDDRILDRGWPPQ